jgi:hypothetical protein
MCECGDGFISVVVGGGNDVPHIAQYTIPVFKRNKALSGDVTDTQVFFTAVG